MGVQVAPDFMGVKYWLQKINWILALWSLGGPEKFRLSNYIILHMTRAQERGMTRSYGQ